MQELLLAVLDPHKELAARVGDALWIGLLLQDHLHVHLRMQFLVGQVDGHILPAHLTEEAKELPPKAVELLRLRIFRQPPAPEILAPTISCASSVDPPMCGVASTPST